MRFADAIDRLRCGLCVPSRLASRFDCVLDGMSRGIVALPRLFEGPEPAPFDLVLGISSSKSVRSD
ncbi:hypothetical protein QIT48_gp17 [Haloterrigena jeotgali icosahedral virus 1]|uniref:Uncharacterized protein n=1 Tax=Haloterrigena jeotgali icosahedral virus 1 TaxID=2766528 RepID=A0A7G2JV09_9VIRU|nr:hypothetical protein QIT48_gp17 [Haloterrigena jeotgali icosahedral virus 1]QCC57390.1 hypothetical protein DVR14_01535 [Natrinema thermotolerans]DAC85295.1 TPA_asm: hypothetical protein HJIV1gp17 [Haloterrigena jeotgali icosahedral virus 1]